MNKTISVVIPARDSQETIRLTINSLIKQTHPPDEVIVVVGENDLTRTSIEDHIKSGFVSLLQGKPPPHMIRDAQWKRWFGAHNVTSNIIFFTDSKVIVEENALQESLDLMEQHSARVIAGMVPAWPEQSSHFMAKIQDSGLIQNNPCFPEASFLTKENFAKSESLPCTGAIAMDIQVFHLIQDDFGVEFSATTPSYEDYVIAWLLVKKGIPILTTNRVIAFHKHRLVWKEYLTQISRSGLGAAALRHHYPECPFGKKRLFQSLLVLGSIALALATITYLILTSLFVVLWSVIGLVLSVFFCLGLINALKAKDLECFFIPPITAVVIIAFVFSFIKGWLKNGQLKPEEALEYLQLH